MYSFKIKILICLFFAFCSIKMNAQIESSIQGRVVDIAEEAVVFATVVIYNAADSIMVKGEYTNDAGIFNFFNIQKGTYWIEVNYLGLAPFKGSLFQFGEGQVMEIPNITLGEITTQMDEVLITGRKPLLERKSDRLVFNIEKSINAVGSNALELLQKSPGILLDNNGNISMMGRSGVIVTINGKNSPLRGEDLVSYLRTLQGSQIEAIEIISDPGAHYEAAGNAGIVNIRLKKDDNVGSNGNVAIGYSFGELPRYNTSLSGNYRNEVFNLYGSYGFNRYQNPYDEEFHIILNDFFLDQQTNGKLDILNHSIKTGLDIPVGTDGVLGFLATGNLSDWDWIANTETALGGILNGNVDSILVAQSHTVIDRTDLAFNMNYRYENKEGIIWNMDADYALYNNKRQNTQPNQFLDPVNDKILSVRDFFTDSPTEIDIYTLRLDHERLLGSGKIGVGIKGAFVNAENIFDFYQVIDGLLILNNESSTQFGYTENVNAAYLTYSSPLGEKVNLSAGLRAEQTISTGLLTDPLSIQNEEVKRNYIDFFPSIKLGYNPNENQTLQLSFSRRINRPAYQQLNPFQFKVDELSYVEGNPFLKPEYATTFRVQHSLNFGLTTTLTYSHVKDLIAQIYEAGPGNTNIYSTVNLANQHHYSVNVGTPLSITEKWSTYSNLTAYYVKNLGNLGETYISKEATALAFSLQNTYQLPGNFNFEVSGFYNSPTIWGVNEEIGTIWSIDLGLEKKILDGQGTLSVSATDIFKTNIWPSFSEFGPIAVDYTRREDTRRLNLSFSYLLGNIQLKGSRERERGLEEEKRRTS